MTILHATPHSRSQDTATSFTARNHVVVSSDSKHRVPPPALHITSGDLWWPMGSVVHVSPVTYRPSLRCGE